MLLIPVIDLLRGRAVAARCGRRRKYRPIASPLCEHGEVLPLVQRLVATFGFARLYIADLDAIERQGDNRALLQRIAERFPGLELWIDAGFVGPPEVEALASHLAMRPVIGSESWRSRKTPPGAAPVLSIDADSAGLRDPSGVARDAARRPRDLILMNLSRVGSGRGPDLGLLHHWRRQAPGSRLYSAGGVRDPADLLRLREAGATGVLLSSALHRGDISVSDVAVFS